MKKAICAVAAMSLAFGCFAKGSVKGSIINKTSGEPIDFASIQLVDSKTGQNLPIGTSSDADGSFTLNNIPDGNYQIGRASCRERVCQYV